MTVGQLEERRGASEFQVNGNEKIGRMGKWSKYISVYTLDTEFWMESFWVFVYLPSFLGQKLFTREEKKK